MTAREHSSAAAAAVAAVAAAARLMLKLRQAARQWLQAGLLTGLCLSAGVAAAQVAAQATAPATPTTAAPAASTPATSAPTPAALPPGALDTQAQALKDQVLKLNRDLLVLEEELLFPASTQVALFVSLDVGKLFELDSVQVKLDDKVVANYLYTPLEVAALQRGGVQRLFVGNLRAGEHEITAFFTGKGPHERDYKRATTLKFEKGSEPRYVELRIRDKLGKLQPEFDVKVWP